MSNPSPKLVMMRFDPRGGWVKPSDGDFHVQDADLPANVPTAIVEKPVKFSAESLTELGDSILDVFNTLKIEDPRLQVWGKVNSAIQSISKKLTEQQLLEERLVSIKAEIEDLRALASAMVGSAYQNEVDVHATSKVRVQVAESLNKKITKALKG
jgi:hypothetical protein